MRTPSIEQVQPPEAEPISVNEVKTYLRIDGDSENDLIGLLIKSATEAAEKYMRNSIITRQWKIDYDNEVPQEVNLPYGPVDSLDEVKLFLEDGTDEVFSDEKYYLTSGNRSVFFTQIPSARRVEITYTAGFSEDAENVPGLIKNGLLSHIAYMFEKRLSEGVGLNDTARGLYDFYRNISI